MSIYKEKEKRENQLKWDLYFLRLVREVATNSKCLSRQIGALLVRDKSIIATGYNGPPRGIPHCRDVVGGSEHINHPFYTDKSIDYSHFKNLKSNSSLIGCPRKFLGYGSGEGLHLCPAAHAERNTIANAALNGVCTKGCTLYMNCVFCCKDCFGELINAGIKTIVISQKGFYDPLAEWMLAQTKIEVRVVKEE